jgi:hypothetical protein
MTQSYSDDLRIRVIDAVSGGLIDAPGGEAVWDRQCQQVHAEGTLRALSDEQASSNSPS